MVGHLSPTKVVDLVKSAQSEFPVQVSIVDVLAGDTSNAWCKPTPSLPVYAGREKFCIYRNGEVAFVNNEFRVGEEKTTC